MAMTSWNMNQSTLSVLTLRIQYYHVTVFGDSVCFMREIWIALLLFSHCRDSKGFLSTNRTSHRIVQLILVTRLVVSKRPRIVGDWTRAFVVNMNVCHV